VVLALPVWDRLSAASSGAPQKTNHGTGGPMATLCRHRLFPASVRRRRPGRTPLPKYRRHHEGTDEHYGYSSGTTPAGLPHRGHRSGVSRTSQTIRVRHEITDVVLEAHCAESGRPAETVPIVTSSDRWLDDRRQPPSPVRHRGRCGTRTASSPWTGGSNAADDMTATARQRRSSQTAGR
jgi:hypothetical protein